MGSFFETSELRCRNERDVFGASPVDDHFVPVRRRSLAKSCQIRAGGCVCRFGRHGLLQQYRFTVHVRSRPVKLRAPGGPPDSPATRHPLYGYGAILSQEGSGDETRLTVYFDRAGKKKFVARYADLTPA